LFNSLKYAKILESSGITRKQAEAHIQVLSRVMGEDVATKHDFAHLNNKMDSLQAVLRSDMRALESTMNGLDSRIDGLDSKIDGLDSKIDGVEGKIDGVEGKMDSRFQQVNDKFDSKFEFLDKKMDVGFKQVDEKLEKLHYKLQYDLLIKMGALMTFLFGAALGVAGLLFT